MNRFRALSFKYAARGILTAIRDEPNLQIHLFIASLVILTGVLLDIKTFDWTVLIFLIGFVITLELTNTAIEEIVNSFTQREHPSAKKAKDVAAGAVLVSAITASIIGLLIFLPYLH
jgi:undecaprenol kinase